MEERKLMEVIGETLGIDVNELRLDTELIADLGVDSLDMFQIMTAIEDEFYVEIIDQEFELVKTIGDVLQVLKRMKNE